MSRFMRRIYKREEGFTLIELLFVIAILGILALLAVPKMANFTETAKQKTDEANRRTLMSAASIWYAQNADQISDEGETWTGENDEGWTAYLQEWPEHPEGNKKYKVKIDKEGNITVDANDEENDDGENDDGKN